MTTRTKLWSAFGGIILLTAVTAHIALPEKLNVKLPFLQRSFDLRLGLDLQGGASLVYEANTEALAAADQAAALDSARDVIEQRVNAFGVSEPVVQTSRVGDKWRIIVELAGIKDISQAIQLIGDTPILEFQEAGTPPAPTAEQKAAAEKANAEVKKKAESILTQARTAGADFAKLANENTQDPSNAGTDGQGKGGDLGFAQRGTFVAEFEKALFDDLQDGEVTSKLVKTQFGYHIIKRIEARTTKVDGKDVQEVRGSHILFTTTDPAAQTSAQFVATGLTGKQLKRADVTFAQTTGEPEVALTFNDEGSKLFAEITKRNIGKTIAIFLDGQILSNPTVNQEITGGNAVISGSFTLKDAKDLARRLNAGALPVPVTLVSQQTVGASLGADSIQRSLFAGLLGIIVVALFMIFFYRLPGFLSVIALGLYTLLVLTIFKLWPVTLTLAGIAGFILTIGIAVDANILIFERTKEELRAGHPLDSAIQEGFKRAWLSIRDSNASSMITALILIWFGSSLIKGFAITLLIGIVVSLFSAITVTRNLLRLVIQFKWAQKLSLYGVRLDSSEPK
ncbi:MAG: protein translocase subunit SecD [Patescibacteria group bacterium]|jgi:protein-export membrane protein SecD